VCFWVGADYGVDLRRKGVVAVVVVVGGGGQEGRLCAWHKWLRCMVGFM